MLRKIEMGLTTAIVVMPGAFRWSKWMMGRVDAGAERGRQ
jgi:hypothetical protein